MVKNPFEGEEIMAEINIVPLNDVLLVLLIIFMIAATAIAQTGFNINLPKVIAKEESKPAIINIHITKFGDIFVGAHKVKFEILPEYLMRLVKVRLTNRVVIKADKDVIYGTVIGVMDACKRAGLTSIGLAAQKKE